MSLGRVWPAPDDARHPRGEAGGSESACTWSGVLRCAGVTMAKRTAGRAAPPATALRHATSAWGALRPGLDPCTQLADRRLVPDRPSLAGRTGHGEGGRVEGRAWVARRASEPPQTPVCRSPPPALTPPSDRLRERGSGRSGPRPGALRLALIGPQETGRAPAAPRFRGPLRGRVLCSASRVLNTTRPRLDST